MSAKFNPSYHITGNFPIREADSEDREMPCYQVRVPRGFETLDIAVYGDGLCDADAEEAAFEYLLENFPQALSSREIARGEFDL
jgi:hypothetical protein